MPAQRLPWIKFWPEALEHEKFAKLTDAEAWTWVVVWAKASLQDKRWRFASLEHAAKVTGRPKRHLQKLVEVGLLDEKLVEEKHGLVINTLNIHNAPKWQDASSITPNLRNPDLTKGDGRVTDDPVKGDGWVTEGWRKGDLEGEGDIDRDGDRDGDGVPPSAEPRAARARTRAPARETLTRDQRSELVQKWTEPFGGNPAEVEAEIDRALNNNGRLNVRSERGYVDSWLHRELRDYRPSRGRKNGATPMQFAPECSCIARREWLKINKNSNPVCDLHGDVRDLAP